MSHKSAKTFARRSQSVLMLANSFCRVFATLNELCWEKKKIVRCKDPRKLSPLSDILPLK